MRFEIHDSYVLCVLCALRGLLTVQGEERERVQNKKPAFFDAGFFIETLKKLKLSDLNVPKPHRVSMIL